MIYYIWYNGNGDNMNIDNVVMVRVMTHLPLNGELVPSYEGKRLVYDQKSEFYFFMQKQIEKELESRIGRPLNIYFGSEDAKLRDDLMQIYTPLTGDYYTTTLSFSLNGMVPDDINNKFSDMNIAVIDPIKNHLNENFVSIDAIDTTIKDRISVSKDAILLIENKLFSSLSDDIKINLKNHFKIKLFEGKLREAVDNTLKENNYPVLPLVQKREMNNIEECPERESMLLFENQFAESVNASRQSLQNLTFSYSELGTSKADRLAHDKLKEEFPNTLKIEEYYRNQLYEFLLSKAENFGIEVTDKEKYYLFTDFKEGEEVMKKITSSLIEKIGGINEFKNLIQEYNQYLIDNYLTNKQIISLSNSKKI